MIGICMSCNGEAAGIAGIALSALTQGAFLFRAYGGLIEPISSGQEEE